jgi:ATP-dependent helicase/nuclease subunit A
LRVDNLIFDNDNIWIIDYKSDLLIPSITPSNYIKQLNDYRNAISKIYPNKKIRCGIMWISNAKFEEII